MRRIKREFVIFAYVLLAIFFFWFVLGLVLETDTPVVIISSGSMEPELSAGDVVFVRGTDIGDFRVGDVIVYNCPSKKDLCVRENELIAHRIVEVNEMNGLKTKGDANDRIDRWFVMFSWVKGKMFFKVPYLGKPVVVLRQIMGVV